MRLDPSPRWKNDRVELFALTSADVTEEYIAWLADPEINKFLESRFAPQTRSAVEGFVSAMQDSATDVFFGIRDLGFGEHVGNIKLGPINRLHGLGEIGIMIGNRNAWGRGVGSNAIGLLADIATHELGLRKLTAGCYASNAGSRKSFEKAGFSVEAVRPRHLLLDNQPEDLVLLAKFLQQSGID